MPREYRSLFCTKCTDTLFYLLTSTSTIWSSLPLRSCGMETNGIQCGTIVIVRWRRLCCFDNSAAQAAFVADEQALATPLTAVAFISLATAIPNGHTRMRYTHSANERTNERSHLPIWVNALKLRLTWNGEKTRRNKIEKWIKIKVKRARRRFGREILWMWNWLRSDDFLICLAISLQIWYFWFNSFLSLPPSTVRAESAVTHHNAVQWVKCSLFVRTLILITTERAGKRRKKKKKKKSE